MKVSTRDVALSNWVRAKRRQYRILLAPWAKPTCTDSRSGDLQEGGRKCPSSYRTSAKGAVYVPHVNRTRAGFGAKYPLLKSYFGPPAVWFMSGAKSESKGDMPGSCRKHRSTEPQRLWRHLQSWRRHVLLCHFGIVTFPLQSRSKGRRGQLGVVFTALETLLDREARWTPAHS